MIMLCDDINAIVNIVDLVVLFSAHMRQLLITKTIPAPFRVYLFVYLLYVSLATHLCPTTEGGLGVTERERERLTFLNAGSP